MKSDKIYFENIDGLRTFAVIPVIIAHSIGFPYLNLNTENQFLNYLLFLIPSAHYGVKLFFVISGFLITYLLLKEKNVQGHINIRNFFIRRILRIWPLYFLVVFLGFVILPTISYYFIENTPFKSQNIPYDTWWKYLLFMANFDLISSKGITPILGVLWSVSIEEQFYLLWPFIINYFSRSKIFFVFALIILLSLLWWYKFMNSINIYYYHTISNLYDLTIGTLGAYIILYFQNFKTQIENMHKYFIILIYILGACLIYTKILNKYYVDICLPLFFILVILEQSFSKNSIFKISKLKNISNIGRYTYSLYSLHLVVLYFYVIVLKMIKIDFFFNSELIIVILIVGCLFFSLLVSFFSYHYYEKPFLAFNKNVKDGN